jgi:hypothetical protein
MIIEFVLHRLKVPDGANRPPAEPEQHLNDTTAAAAGTAGAGAYSRAESKMPGDSKEEPGEGGAPFLQKMSTDGEESVLCKRSIIVEHPFK